MKRTTTPYVHLVPKDFEANLAWREKVLREAAEDPEAARELWIMCSRDILFFINTFVWTYDPYRHVNEPVRPFISYRFQDDAILQINDAIENGNNIVIQKSRDMGATWLSLLVFFWRWLFKRNQNFLLASRNESYVDQTNNEKGLFQKLDFILEHLPGWLKPNLNRTAKQLTNKDNRSKIDGESATGDLGRGDRRTAMLWDEVAAWDRADGFRAMSSTSATTRCKIINSTPQGIGDAYHTMATTYPVQLRMHWSQHPEKNRGLYSSKQNKLEIIDKEYVFPDGYDFICDGKLRSPYYDDFCITLPIPSLVAQEQDIDFGGSGSQFYDQAMLAHVKSEYCRPACFVGDLPYDSLAQPIGLFTSSRGALRMWVAIDDEKRVLKGRKFSIGVDISAGTGASRSVISIADTQTGEKVAEFASNTVRPEELARQAVALARLFNEAFLIWEANGPGRQFGAVVLELGYRNIYYREDEAKFPAKRSQVPGWWSTPQTKRVLLMDYGIALAKSTFINRSAEAIAECAEIVYMTDGTIGHARSVASLDPSGGGENHGDAVIADALCSKGTKLRPFEAEKPSDTPPMGSFLWRRKERLKAEQKKRSDFEFS